MRAAIALVVFGGAWWLAQDGLVALVLAILVLAPTALTRRSDVE